MVAVLFSFARPNIANLLEFSFALDRFPTRSSVKTEFPTQVDASELIVVIVIKWFFNDSQISHLIEHPIVCGWVTTWLASVSLNLSLYGDCLTLAGLIIKKSDIIQASRIDKNRGTITRIANPINREFLFDCPTGSVATINTTPVNIVGFYLHLTATHTRNRTIRLRCVQWHCQWPLA